MKINLLNKPGYVPGQTIAPFEKDLFQDLVLDNILQIMAKNDKYIYQQCRNILLTPLTDYDNIAYRQSSIRDAIRNKKTILSLYATVAEVVTDLSNLKTKMRKDGESSSANVKLINSIELLDLLSTGLERLKKEIVDTYGHFTGTIFRDFYDDFLKEFDTDFMKLVHDRTKALQMMESGGEIQISGVIGKGLKMDGMFVNSIAKYKETRKQDIINSLFLTRVNKNEIRISYNDISLNADCKQLESHALLHVASCFDEFSKEIGKLFDSLRSQLAFFYGCCNLYSQMHNLLFPVSFPDIDKKNIAIQAEDLYDLSFALNSSKIPTTNRLEGEDTLIYLITGTNHGGKTTFIRSVSVAQLMAQCGMFVPASNMKTHLFNGFYTHFVRKEDVTLNSGKLEEELNRLSKIVDFMKPGSIIFLNESFATTSEREGALIAEDVIKAFMDNNVTCFFVTHIYTYAKKAYDEKMPRTQFLQAERNTEGERTYHLTSGEPGITGYGMELYNEIVGGE